MYEADYYYHTFRVPLANNIHPDVMPY